MIVIMKRSHDEKSKQNSFIIGFLQENWKQTTSYEICNSTWYVFPPNYWLNTILRIFVLEIILSRLVLHIKMKGLKGKRKTENIIWLILRIIERMIIKTSFLTTWQFYINYWKAMFYQCIFIADPVCENLQGFYQFC